MPLMQVLGRRISVSLRLAWCIEQVLGQPELHGKIYIENNNKQTVATKRLKHCEALNLTYYLEENMLTECIGTHM